jgi:hypothetical protein
VRGDETRRRGDAQDVSSPGLLVFLLACLGVEAALFLYYVVVPKRYLFVFAELEQCASG